MNDYLCFYKGKQIQVMADTSFHARSKACETLKPRKEWEVTVVLIEKNGSVVIQHCD